MKVLETTIGKVPVEVYEVSMTMPILRVCYEEDADLQILQYKLWVF
jgi:hypothetical protein